MIRIKDIESKEVRELALKRCDTRHNENSLLCVAFNWWETPEGLDFWTSVASRGIPSLTKSKEDVNRLISEELNEFKAELLQKNEDYNNSLHSPNIFGQEPIEGLKARMSDKFNRIISKGFDDLTEDSMRDLFGYYIHYCIMKGKV